MRSREHELRSLQQPECWCRSRRSGGTDWFGERSMATAAVLVLAGGFILRIVIFFSAEGVEP